MLCVLIESVRIMNVFRAENQVQYPSQMPDKLVCCTACPRLTDFLTQLRNDFPDYHARPVPSFGSTTARLLVVGLAPGLHGANRTGRPFTGDFAGNLLYSTLHRYGFANQPTTLTATGERDDALLLIDCRVSNAVRCLPPQNKPLPAEIRHCNRHLAEELATLRKLRVILALGHIAHSAVVRALDLRAAAYPFAHGARFALPDGRALIDSYHCSRYNTQTKRLTERAFHHVFDLIASELAAT